MAEYSELYIVREVDGEEEQSDELAVAEVQALLDSGEINGATRGWTDGMDDWAPLSECAGRFGLVLDNGEGTPPEPSGRLYYTLVDEDGDEEQSDEVDAAEVQALIEGGQLTGATKVWADGMDDWVPLSECASRWGLVLPAGAAGAAGAGAEEEAAKLHYTIVDEDGDEEQSDEVAAAEVQALIDSGQVTGATRVWADGMDDWVPLSECAGRFGLVLPALDEGTPPEPEPQPQPEPRRQRKPEAGGAVAVPLWVHVDRASGLAAADTFGKSDPYCVLVFNGSKLGSTAVINANLDPVWDERRQLPSLRPTQNSLVLQLWDRDDGAKRGDFLGEARLDLDDPSIIGKPQTCELQPRRNKDAKFNKHVQGELLVTVERESVCGIYIAQVPAKQREGHDGKSQQVGMLQPGEIVEALEERTHGSAVRIRTSCGWSTASNTSAGTILEKTDAVIDLTEAHGGTRGWLDFKTHPRMMWRRMWFELHDDNSLRYFRTNSKGHGQERVGALSLRGCRSVGLSEEGLELDCATRCWSLRVRTAEERDSWLRALQSGVAAAGSLKAVTFADGDGEDEIDPGAANHLKSKCQILKEGDAGSFKREWLTLDNSCLHLTGKAGDSFMFDVTACRLGFEKKARSEDESRELQFASDGATYCVRLATPALALAWCDALAATFHDSAKSLWHEGVVALAAPAETSVHLSVTVTGSLLKMFDGHGFDRMLRLKQCSRLRRGTAGDLSFQLEHAEDGSQRPVTFRFCAGSPGARDCWYAVLKREMARVAPSSAVEPTRQLGQKLMAAIENAPLLDEDIQHVLFHAPGAAAAADGGDGAAGDAPFATAIDGVFREVMVT